jgi:serine/threonine protein kinase
MMIEELSKKVDASFKVYFNSTVLVPDMSRKLVRHAHKRIEKSAINGFVVEDDIANVGTLEHSQLDLGECLGQGSFSSVFEIKAIRSEKRQYDADRLVVKVLRPKLSANPPMLSACAADLVKEGMIMATLNHRNILSAKAWAPTGVSAYSNGRHDAFFLVLDRLEVILSDRIKRWQKETKQINFSFKQRQSKRTALLKERTSVILQLSEAVKYMHSKRILHRDLKPDNIGFDRDGVLKVFDFDVARILPEAAVPDDTFLLTKKIGSPRYMSPECARGEEYNLKADVYTFALLCHELISLKKPYGDLPSGKHDDLVFFAGVRPIVPNAWPQKVGSLLARCWADDISSRPTMEETHQILEKEFPLMVGEKESKKSKSRLMRRSRTLPVIVCA